MPDTNSTQNNNGAEESPQKPLVVDRMPEVIAKIGAAQNILIALSSDPSVDEMAAAIGLTMFLDRAGKRATAIYSGTTPNALQFLEPEKTFDNSADCLQDFIVALNKEKADHIRYKLDGDFVKVYITPYKARIQEEDLNYSYGDYNVDLVIALDVANGIDLDDALHEHGRIMHDASIINITTGRPGKFGEVEWSDAEASSVSEMVAKLLFVLANKEPLEPNEATAIMTGIVAATYRFSNARTAPSTLAISSKLMEYGANQQLIAKNITPDIDNEMTSPMGVVDAMPVDATRIEVGHAEEGTTDSEHEVDTGNLAEDEGPIIDESLMNELKRVSENIAEEVAQNPVAPAPVEEAREVVGPQIPTPGAASAPAQPVVEAAPEPQPEPEPMQVTDYGQMMNEALSEVENPAVAAAPAVAKTEINNVPDMDFASAPEAGGTMISAPDLAGQSLVAEENTQTPATGESYIVETKEKVLSPSNDLPMPDESILPPPPVPPVDFSEMGVSNPEVFESAATVANMQTPAGNMAAANVQFGDALPAVDSNMMASPAIGSADMMASQVVANNDAPSAGQLPEKELGDQPAMVDQVYNPVANNPGAFKIPGM